MNRLTKFIKSTGIFLIGSLLPKLVMFLLLPLYTRFIPSDAYGYYDLTIAYSGLVVSAIYIEIWFGLIRYSLERKSLQEKSCVVFSGFVLFVFSTIIYIALGTVFSQFVEVKYLYLVIIYGIFHSLSLVYSFLSRGFENNVAFVISGIMSSITVVIVNIVLIIFLRVDYSSLYIAAISGSVVQILYLEFKLKFIRCFKFSMFEKSLLKEIVLFSIPLCFNSISYWFLNSFGRVAISQLLPMSENGYYAIGNKFSAVVVLFTTCFSYAWQEISFTRKADDPQNGLFFSNGSNLYLKFLSICIILIIPILKFAAPILINSDYSSALKIIPSSLMVSLVMAFSSFMVSIFLSIKRTKEVSISSVVSAVINIPLTYVLIRLFGIEGVNFSIILSVTISIAIRYALLHKLISYSLNIINISIILLWFSVTYGIYRYTAIYVNLIWFLICLPIAFIYSKNDIIAPIYSSVKTLTQRKK